MFGLPPIKDVEVENILTSCTRIVLYTPWYKILFPGTTIPIGMQEFLAFSEDKLQLHVHI